ncbi:hypothetical protein EXIGLDRAFT_729349 [Exidia glandulosa HHB12029]|uniref:Uncharacterized protein n=1 Tax=Exidia glandulosa HHB12029 TaxID=1314781 RepID=A0A165CLD9_EXIGL|nr:hypothetical protein EXIGLDRAFT_729349 [Exidia glandulosa HHB12029]
MTDWLTSSLCIYLFEHSTTQSAIIVLTLCRIVSNGSLDFVSPCTSPVSGTVSSTIDSARHCLC